MSTLTLPDAQGHAPPNTVAWIDPHAFSAGTVALACREIVIALGMFGDSAPVSPLGPIPQTERAKIESPLTEVVDLPDATADERLVQAFVSLGIELWLLENAETGRASPSTGPNTATSTARNHRRRFPPSPRPPRMPPSHPGSTR